MEKRKNDNTNESRTEDQGMRAERKERNETERTKRFYKERNGWERNTLHLRRNNKVLEQNKNLEKRLRTNGSKSIEKNSKKIQQI